LIDVQTFFHIAFFRLTKPFTNMKYLYSFLFIFVVTSASAQNETRIFFFRDSNLASAIGGYDVYLDSILVGRIDNGVIQSYSCAPGEHRIHAKTGTETSIAVNLKPGVTYYMECSVVVDPSGGHPTFKLVPATEGKSAIKKIDPKAAAKIVVNSGHPQDEFGLKTGVNFSRFSASINSISSATTGFHFGLYYKTWIEGNFYFRPELLFSSQGQKDEYHSSPSGPAVGTTTTTINYLNVPLLFETGKVVTFHFGPQLGLALSGKEVGTIDGTPVNDDLKNIMNFTDLSLLVGLGISPSKHFHLGLRYQFGMTNIFKTSNGGPASDIDVKNRVIHAYAAISF
jgi:hypothetical protein